MRESESMSAYAGTLEILKGYRDTVWGMELSLRQTQESLGKASPCHMGYVEQNRQIIKRLEDAVELLRARHRKGELYYWLLYYTYLSPHQLRTTEEILESLRLPTKDISFRTYYRRRREAVAALDAVLGRNGSELA